VSTALLANQAFQGSTKYPAPTARKGDMPSLMDNHAPRAQQELMKIKLAVLNARTAHLRPKGTQITV
jgi:hypothetical protein